MIRRPPRSTHCISSAASDVYKRQIQKAGVIEQKYLGKCECYQALNRERLVLRIESKGVISDIYQHAQLNHPYLTSILNYDTDYQDLIGVDREGGIFYFDYYQTCLQDIIDVRRQRNHRFQEKEIMRMGEDLISVLSYLELQGHAHWDLRPSSIFYDRKKKQIKIYNNELIFGKFAALQNLANKLDSLPTPEYMQCVKTAQILGHPDQNDIIYLEQYKNKIDTYQLGLVLLEIATYRPSTQLFYKNQIMKSELDRRLQEVQMYYSRNLSQIIAKLLEPDPVKRLKPSQLQPLKTDPIQQVVVYPIQNMTRNRSTTSQQLTSSFISNKCVPTMNTSNSRVQILNQPTIIINGPKSNLDIQNQQLSKSLIKAFPQTSKAIHTPIKQTIIQFPISNNRLQQQYLSLIHI
eukprot:TRINITY_DN1844_c0_g1_i8.p1 TRINITY_DN1844_c0_g1~~TRINITY_DN1844_c0_g1_i8.p1  ORF type:complete len:406 (-),score=56.64 TRINITY_DN1844_c0_g1_i8:4-1221(-)